jgi:hypothetical protein
VPIAYDASRSALYTPECGDTVFERGQPYSPLQLAVEAARLAYYRAEASTDERARLTEALDRVDFAEPTLFVHAATGGAAFGTCRRSDGTMLLAFRGTQPDNLRNLLSDARANLVAWSESAGRAHSGFATAARALLPQILQWIESARAEPERSIMTGHSLGAALATLVATTRKPTWLVTLGSPRVGDAALASTVTAAHTVRLVDCCDAVTEMPPPVGGYVHVGLRTYLTADGQVVENATDETVTRDRLRAQVRYAFRYATRFWRNVLIRPLADHAPINYARAFFP